MRLLGDDVDDGVNTSDALVIMLLELVTACCLVGKNNDENKQKNELARTDQKCLEMRGSYMKHRLNLYIYPYMYILIFACCKQQRLFIHGNEKFRGILEPCWGLGSNLGNLRLQSVKNSCNP